MRAVPHLHTHGGGWVGGWVGVGVRGGHLPQLAVGDDLVDAHARLAAL